MDQNPKKEIVIVNQDSGYLMVDIANTYVMNGYKVTLITGRLVLRNIPLSNSIIVKRIIEYNRKTSFYKLTTATIAFVQILTLIVVKYRNSNLLIVSNPPFAPLLPLLVHNRFSLLIFDIYPDAMCELGILKPRSFIVKIWELANKKVYKDAEFIFTISEGMKKVLLKYTNITRIEVVPLWSDNEFLKPVHPKANPFLNKHKINGRFVVFYSGNIGITQNIEILINIAEKIKRKDIIFIIIGDGIRRRHIEEMITERRVTNCILLPWQDYNEIIYSFSAADLAVVSLGNFSSSIAIPSKFYNFLSVGAPILGLASTDSELHQIIKDMNVGRCFMPDDEAGIVNYIIDLADNPVHCKELKLNSLNASKQFTSVNALKFVSVVNNKS